jgi:branched-chain amino acid aminotransferase
MQVTGTKAGALQPTRCELLGKTTELARRAQKSMFGQSLWAWMDGEVVPWNQATIHVSSHALHYGTGVFEGIRCYDTTDGPAIFRADAHLDRLYASASAYGMQIAYSSETLLDAMCELIRRNAFRSCYVRPICCYGSGSLGLLPNRCPVHVAILAWPWETLHGESALQHGVHIGVSRWTKFHSSMMPTTAKACGQYLNSILALRDVTRDGFDEALLMEVGGTIAEGAGENMFLVKGGALLTNDQRHSILMGVTRDAVMNIAGDLAIPVDTRALQLDDLVSAEEAFLTGTAAEITPIRAVDSRPIGDGARGPVTKLIQERFFAITGGREPTRRAWLHRVPGTTA